MTLYANGVSAFFKEQAIRMRRTTWSDPNILAEELYAILSRVPDSGTGPISIVPPVKESNDPGVLTVLDLPPTENLGIPPYDLAFYDVPTLISDPAREVTTTEDGQKQVTNTIETFVRAMVPGKITAIDDTTRNYFMTIYPVGLDGETVTISEVKQLQLTGGIIPIDSWGFVLRITKLVITEVLTEEEMGRVTKQTTISVPEGYPLHYVQFPVWL